MAKQKEHKKGKCRKCNKRFYIHDHHILPKSIFGEDGETISLCPNCHTHCHEYMKKKITNFEDKNEVLKVWKKWYNKIKVIVPSVLLLIGLIYTAYNFF